MNALSTHYPALYSLLDEVYDTYEVMAVDNSNVTRQDVLKIVMKRRHYWPDIQIKPFFDKSGLVLLHNSYIRDVAFQALYNECRSVVVDLNGSIRESIVLSLSYSIPTKVSLPDFEAAPKEDDLVYESALEGTTLFVYCHNGKWRVGTSSCPSADNSYYFHPEKSHGKMMDEALGKPREEFFAHLDPQHAYTFVLVHYENGHIMDYTRELGPEYAKLVHITTRDRETYEEVDSPLEIDGLLRPTRFASLEEAATWLREGGNYAFVAKRPGQSLTKVMLPEIKEQEEETMGHPNPWYNMLAVFQKNRPDFQVRDYIQKYLPNWTPPVDGNGRPIQPVPLFVTVFKAIQRVLYGCYRATSYFNREHQMHKINRAKDAEIPPILRFHLAQLRNIQGPITMKVVYHYLCFHTTMKNLCLLIKFFATCDYCLYAPEARAFELVNELLI